MRKKINNLCTKSKNSAWHKAPWTKKKIPIGKRISNIFKNVPAYMYTNTFANITYAYLSLFMYMFWGHIQ